MQQKDILQSSGLIGDQPTGKDYLGFRPYVLAVHAFLTDPNTIPPLTVSVEGEWGSGKSSFLKQLKEELIPERKRPFYSVCFYPWQFRKNRQLRYAVSFNPWRYNENEALWAAFAIEFERQIYKAAPWQQRVWFKLCQIDYAKLAWDIVKIAIPILFVKWLLPIIFNELKTSELFKTVSSLFALIPIFFPAKEFVKELQTKLSNNAMSLKFKDYLLERPNYNGKIPFLDKFHEDIQKLTSSLCGQDPIYVFIDDLDRCEPGQALELMQALNLLISDELKIIFILAIDRKKVAAGYAAKHFHLVQYLEPIEFRLGEPQAERFKTYAAVQYGYEFLEKFIQIPFQLPIPKEPNLNQLLNHIVKFKPKESSIKNQSQEKASKAISSEFPKLEQVKTEPVSGQFRIEENPTIAQDIMTMIAPVLGNNPRRIKKFFNIYRLQTYIGSRTGLFAMKLASDNYQQKLSPIQLAKVLIIAQAWPHFIDHWQQFRYFVLYLSDYTSSKKHWSVEKLQEFKNTVCGMAGFQAGSDDAEQYWKIFTYWSKQEPLMSVFNYKADEGKQFQIWAVHIGDFLTVSPVYKTEQFTIPPLVTDTPLQSAEVASSKVTFKGIDPSQVPASEYSAARVGEILKEVEDYLNANLEEGEIKYFLDGAAAETAYVMRANGHTLPEIKAEIDRLLGRSTVPLYTDEYFKQEAIQKWLGGESFRYQDSSQDKAAIEKIFNEIRLEASDNDKYPQGIDEGILESVQVMYENGTPPGEIKTEILKYLSTPINDSLSNAESGVRETDTGLIRSIFSQIVQEIRAEYPDIAPFPFEDQVEEFSLILLERGDSAESVKQQILDYLKNPNRVDEVQPQSDASPEKKPFAYDVEGQGHDEGYWDDEPPTTEGILRRNPPQGPPPTPNEASEPETRIREATVNEIPGNWDELEGMVGEPRYVQETRNPETDEWENPVYLGTVNPNVDSWENIDRVKNFETGELYSDEEWAKLQEKQSDQGSPDL